MAVNDGRFRMARSAWRASCQSASIDSALTSRMALTPLSPKRRAACSILARHAGEQKHLLGRRGHPIVVAAALVVVAIAPITGQPNPYTTIEKWGQLPEGTDLGLDERR